MARRRYFAGELQWVFGRCARCGSTKEVVARVPRWDGRWCRACLAIRKRLLFERERLGRRGHETGAALRGLGTSPQAHALEEQSL